MEVPVQLRHESNTRVQHTQQEGGPLHNSLPVDVVRGGLVFCDGVYERVACARVLDEQAAHAHGDGAHFARVAEGET